MSKNRRKPSKKGFKILFKYLFKYKKEIILLSFLGVISGFANAAVPYIVGSFFDAILNVSKMVEYFSYTIPLWMALVILFGFIQIFANLSDWIIDRKSRKISILAHAEYVVISTAHLLNLPLSFHKENKTGEVWDKITRAGNSLNTLLGDVIISLAPQIFSVFIGLIIAAYINLLLASILIVGIILYVVTLFIIVPPIVVLQRKGYELWGNAFGHAHDSIINFQIYHRYQIVILFVLILQILHMKYIIFSRHYMIYAKIKIPKISIIFCLLSKTLPVQIYLKIN